MAAEKNHTPRITAVFVGLLGLAMTFYGGELALLGGSPYYVVAGLGLAFSAWQLWQRKPSGFHAYAGVLLLTLAWAVYEAGLEFWLVGSRIWIIGLILRLIRFVAGSSSK